MEFQFIFSMLIVCTAGVAYVISAYLVISGDTTNFWSWFLWGILDAIALIPTLKAGDNGLIIEVYTIGSLVVAAVALYRKQTRFTRFEGVVIALALICFVGAQLFKPETAIILSTTVIMLVGLSLLLHVYNKKTRFIDTYIVILFLVAAITSNLLARGLGDSTVFLDATCTYTTVWLLLTEYSRRKKVSV